MDCAIFIRSYWKDLDWLAHCLTAIERHAIGFAEVVVVVPQRSMGWVRRRRWPTFARFETTPDCDDDYLGQQASKLYADQWTACAAICHLDSDSLLCRPTRPEDLFDLDRARIAVRPLAPLGRHYPWRECTERFLGLPMALDFMCRPPFVFPRWLYPELREFCRARHATELADYVLAQPPRAFSEFNALGSYAWHLHRERFAFTALEDCGPEHCRWFWSWDGVETMRERIAEALGDD